MGRINTLDQKNKKSKGIELTPVYFLFHGSMGFIKSYKNSVIPHLLNAAKRLIPRFWKQTTCAMLREWKMEVDKIKEAERWVYRKRNKQDKFDKIWAKWESLDHELDRDESN